MRNAIVQLILVIIGIYSIHAARLLATSSIHLRIRPIGAEKKVRAIQGHDTLEMTGMSGVYALRSINPGKWVVVVNAKPPYEDVRLNLTVDPGDNFDLGNVLLRSAGQPTAGASAGRPAVGEKKGTLAVSPDFD